MAGLKAAVGDRIPSRAECEALMAQYAMRANIVEHSLEVMNVALAIIDNLKSDVQTNRDLVIAATLLHDITKTRSLETRENHALSGGTLLRELGFTSTAEIVEQHVIMRDINLGGRLEEREIVYYADKRVRHTVIVTLEERVADLIDRYGTTEAIRTQILQNKQQALLVEQKIAGFLKGDMHQQKGQSLEFPSLAKRGKGRFNR